MREDTWKAMFEGYCGEGAVDTRDKYYMPLPVWTGGNVFFNDAKPCDIEDDYTVDDHKVSVEVKCENGRYRVDTDYAQYLPEAKLITSETLGKAIEPEERFENPDGSDIVFDIDYYGQKRTGKLIAGPFALQ